LKFWYLYDPDAGDSKFNQFVFDPHYIFGGEIYIKIALREVANRETDRQRD